MLNLELSLKHPDILSKWFDSILIIYYLFVKIIPMSVCSSGHYFEPKSIKLFLKAVTFTFLASFSIFRTTFQLHCLKLLSLWNVSPGKENSTIKLSGEVLFSDV